VIFHTVYTRQCYDDDKHFRARMELARRTCIPAMVAAAKNLKPDVVIAWAWRAHERHLEAIERIVRDGGWTHALEVLQHFGPGRDDIQSTLDSDDRIRPTFLYTIEASYFTIQGYERPRLTELRSWQPIKQRLEDGACFRHRYRYEEKGRVSPFYAIYNPTAEVHVYARSHGQMHQLLEPRWSREPGAIAVIHGANRLMDLRASDTPIRRRS
jgi:hypothetical protein